MLGKEKYLNDEEIFNLWRQLPSIEKVIDHLTQKGKINPDTGKPFTRMAIWHSAWRYALDNPNETYKYFEDRKTREEYWNKLVKVALTVYLNTSTTRFLDWIKKHNLERFNNIYADKIGEVEKELKPIEEMI
jgi:hypothetical protein